MAKIIVKQFQFDRAPQSLPRTRVHLINKHTPKLREECLYSLSQATDQSPFLACIKCSYQQRLRFICQLLSYILASIAVVCKRYSSISHMSQRQCRFSITRIARCKQPTNKMSVDVDRGMQFEAKEPSFAGFAKVCSFFSKQSHTPMPYRTTDWYRLGVVDGQVHLKAIAVAGRFTKMTCNITQSVKACNPLFVRAKHGKGQALIKSSKQISLLQGGDTKTALHQSDSDYLSICKERLLIGRASPMSQSRVSFEVIINKAVDFSHLIYNRSQRGRPPGEEFCFATL